MAKRNIPFLDSSGQLVKKCNICDQIIPLTREYYHVRNSSSTGFGVACIECIKEKSAIYYANNKERIRIRRSTPEIRRQTKKQNDSYYANPDNRERISKQKKAYNAIPKNKKRSQARSRERKKNDYRLRLSSNVGSLMSRSIKGNKNYKHWETLVDFTFDELKKHLMKQFKSGMSWENYGKVWSLDHIIPQSVFNFQTYDDIDFKKCWALNNLQPLFVKENISKGNKIEKPFQPSLAFGGAL